MEISFVDIAAPSTHTLTLYSDVIEFPFVSKSGLILDPYSICYVSKDAEWMQIFALQRKQCDNLMSEE